MLDTGNGSDAKRRRAAPRRSTTQKPRMGFTHSSNSMLLRAQGGGFGPYLECRLIPGKATKFRGGNCPRCSGKGDYTVHVVVGLDPPLAKRMRERRARVYRQPFAARLDAGAVDPRPHGAGRPVRVGRQPIGERSDAVLRTAMARRLSRRAAGVSDRT